MEVLIALVIFVGLGIYVVYNIKKEAEKDKAKTETVEAKQEPTIEPVSTPPVVTEPTPLPDTVTVVDAKPADNTINVKELVAAKKTKPKAKKQTTTATVKTIEKPKAKSRSKKSTDKA